MVSGRRAGSFFVVVVVWGRCIGSVAREGEWIIQSISRTWVDTKHDKNKGTLEYDINSTAHTSECMGVSWCGRIVERMVSR